MKELAANVAMLVIVGVAFYVFVCMDSAWCESQTRAEIVNLLTK